MQPFSASSVRGDLTSLADIEATLRAADLTALPSLDIAVLRNVVVEPIEPYLRFLALESGLRADVRFGQYDQIAQEALGVPGGPITSATAVVIVVPVLEPLSPALARGFAGLEPAQVSAELDRIEAWAQTVVSGIRRQTAAAILWHAFELPLFPALGIADGQQQVSEVGAITTLNERIRTVLAATGSAYLLDTNACRARLGAAAYYDLRYWHIGRAPYSRAALCELALEHIKYVKAVRGGSKKCLVLDCDDVLWGGIVGEDGLAGIKLGQTYPGSAYLEFQREVLSLHHRGVILALCSKNNEDQVWQVFREHPDMVLEERHISAFRINWHDKASNLRELAAELNIGLDSLVFADDSQVECGLVTQMLPQVTVVHLPRERAVEHRARLAAGGWFDTLTISAEDRRRGQQYREEAVRTRLKADATSLEDYFRSLEMHVRIRRADRLTMPRVAQLTQKTNQFNLTTRRYSEEDMSRFASDPDTDVLALHLADRFGDAGLVGVAVVRYGGGAASIDTLLLSCRVLGRGVEDLFLARLLQRARDRGASTAVGEFRPTTRNGIVADFYRAHGFEASGTEHDTQRFSLDLATWPGDEPAHFAAVDAVFEPSSAMEA